MSTTVAVVTCPELATPPGQVIVASNVASLLLSNYSRQAGVRVTVTCLASPEYQLVGAETLTCLPSGQWDQPVPTCRPTVQGVQGAVRGDLTMLPALVVAAIFGFILLVLVALLVYTTCCRYRCPCCRQGVQRVPEGSWPSGKSQDWDAESTLPGRRRRTAASVSDLCEETTTSGYSASLSRFQDDDRDLTLREGSCCTRSTGLTLLHPPPQPFCPHPHHHHSRILRPTPHSLSTCFAGQVGNSTSSESRDTRTSGPVTSDLAPSDLSRPPPPPPPASCPYCAACPPAREGATAPPLSRRVGLPRQTYRTWHELFLRPVPAPWL